MNARSKTTFRLWRWLLVAMAILGGTAAAALASVTARGAASRMNAGPSVAAAGIKPQILGLLDKSSQAPYTHDQPFPPVNPAEVRHDYAAFSGIVINETWAQLEPTEGTFTFGPIRQSLSIVNRYNRRHPAHPLAVKLRIFAGFEAPPWAKTMDGSPITIPTKLQSSGTGTVGQWWKPDYRAAWSGLQHALAARFDRNRLIRSVAVSSCSTLTAEPFVINLSKTVRSQLFADGWSMSAEMQCLLGAFSDYSGWKHTPLDYAFNPLPSVTPGKKSPGPDMTDTDEVMTRCANLLSVAGRDCELSNHALSQDATSSRAAPVLSEINRLYSHHRGNIPVAFQTDNHNRFGGCKAIAVGVKHHADAVELWPPGPGFSGYTAYRPHTLVTWSRALVEGTPPNCS